MFTTGAAGRAFFTVLAIGALTVLLVFAFGYRFYELPLPLAFYTAALLLPFSAFIMEAYFTKPNDVVANSISNLVLLIPLSPLLSEYRALYDVICVISVLALLCACASNLLFNPHAVGRQIASTALKEISVRIGSGKALFGASAILVLLNERDMSTPYFATALIFIFLFLVVDVARAVDRLRRVPNAKRTGTIIGIQGDNLAIGSSPTGRPKIGQRARIRTSDETLNARVVAHHRLHSDSRTTFAILADERVRNDDEKPPVGGFILLDAAAENEIPVGLVNERTTVSTLRFRQLPNATLETGNIVSCQVSARPIYYQIQDAQLIQDRARGEDATDYVEVQAEQIGSWNTEAASFERFGWLPSLYSDVTRPTSFPKPSPEPGEVPIGTIPGTDVPVFLNAEEAVTHHTAILGVTGVGKSVFVRDLVQRLAEPKMKFICVDLTREYLDKFSQFAGLLVSKERNAAIARKLSDLGREQAKWPRERNEELANSLKKDIVDEFKAAIMTFIEDPNRNVAILELADLDGTLENLEYLRWFFRAVFLYARARDVKLPRICLVLEEAHTIVPEWNFMSTDDKGAGHVVNSIAQVALQGRKYGVGLIIVAQRTASVSKTVLTQCNTVIAFQQFDKTSFDFLESFVGGNAARILPNLKPRTAIATGKAIRSTTPLIFVVPELAA